MSNASETPRTLSNRAVFLQITALSAFAIGQPLLQLVRQNPEFLVVHHCRALDVVILTAVLLFLPPMLLALVVYLAGLVHARARLLAHALVLGGLLALTLLPVVDKIPAIEGGLTLALAALPAVILVAWFLRHRFLGRNLAYLAFALPVFLILFLTARPVVRILFPEPSPTATADQSANSPVVVIVLDELPTSTLMTPDLELDRQLFPNFARLAEHSTWYRNATTISPATLRSVPAILTGKFPTWHETPSAAEHPQNIFTLLGSSHQIIAREDQTRLCPPELMSEPVPGLSERLGLLFEDLFILYQHVVIPGAWRSGLVPVSSKWGNFRELTRPPGQDAYPATKMDEFEDFVASLKIGEKPILAVMHILLPHNPFRFFPSGEIYNRRIKVPVLPDLTWGPDHLVMAHSYRRHILNTAAVDRLIGDLLDRLEELDILHDAAIVVTADHGVSHRTGLGRRRFDGKNAADIMFVPLFIKIPGQTVGVIDDRFAQTVDIMPTLAAALGSNTDWSFDGVDLLAISTTDRIELDFLDQDAHEHRKISPAVVQDRNETIRWKHDLFGDEGGLERLFTLGDVSGLLGRDVTGLPLENHPTLRGRILDTQELEDVNLNGHFVPAEFNGIVENHHDEGRLTLALALNGKIVGVTETYLDGPDPGAFNWQITTPLTAFRNGRNEADLLWVSRPDSEPGLLRIPLFTPSFLGLDLGGGRMAGIREEGLFNPHDWDGRPARWTNGRGSWQIPLKPGEKPALLTVGLVSSGPPGADLSVTVNGTRLLIQVLPPGSWETRLPLDGVDIEDRLTVVLESRVFVPAESNPKSTDRRKLGVAVTTLIVSQ